MGWLAPWAQVVEPTRSLPPVPSMAGPLTPRSPLTPCVCLSFPQVDPYLPYEYTCEGMLERIEAYIQHQVGGPSPGTLLRPEEGPSQHHAQEAAPALGAASIKLPALSPSSLSLSFLSRSRGVEVGRESSLNCSAQRPGLRGSCPGSPALEPQPHITTQKHKEFS